MMNLFKISVAAIMLTLGVNACKDDAEHAYRFDGKLALDGWERTYLLNLPPNYYQANDVPLVVALHGTGGSALQCERDYGLTEKAEEQGHAIVYPEGIPRPGPFRIRTWNAGRCCDYAMNYAVDDVGFITTLIDQLVRDYKINPAKIYLTGMSNGAMMAYRMACEHPDKINAMASVSGALMTHSCHPSKPVPVLHIHSERDKVVPYHGGIGLAGYHFPPTDSVVQAWVSLNECNPTPAESKVFESFSYRKWMADNQIAVEYYLTTDGGHSWPGGHIARPGADEPSDAIDATKLIWEFFERY